MHALIVVRRQSGIRRRSGSVMVSISVYLGILMRWIRFSTGRTERIDVFSVGAFPLLTSWQMAICIMHMYYKNQNTKMINFVFIYNPSTNDHIEVK
jgi:hypothetical protein